MVWGLWLFLGAYGTGAWAAPAIIPVDHAGLVSLHGHWSFFEDAEHSVTIDDIVTPEFATQFQPSPHDIPNFGIQKSVFWLRVSIENLSALQNWVVEVDFPPLDYVWMYYPKEDGTIGEWLVGDMVDFDARYIKHRTINYGVDLPQNETVTLHFRMKVRGTVQLPVSLYSQSRFAEHMGDDNILFGVIYGILLVMSVFNLLLFFSLGDRTYLYYVGYLFLSLIFQMCVNGTAFQYIWRNSPEFCNRALLFSVYLAFACGFKFCQSFLRVRPYAPGWDRLLLIATWVSVALAVVSSVFPVWGMTIPASIMGFAGPCLWLGAGVVAAKHGYEPARFFLIGWAVFLFGVVIYGLKTFGLFPSNYLTEYAFQVGLCIEATLLSMALAHRFQVIQNKSEQTHRDYARVQRRLNEELAVKVQIFGGVAHHLNNPLNYMLAAATNIRTYMVKVSDQLNKLTTGAESPDSPAATKVRNHFETIMSQCEIQLDAMQDGVEKTATVVAEIRGISGLDGDTFEEISVAKLVQDSLKLAQQEFPGEKISETNLDLDLGGLGGYLVSGNPFLVGQSLRNVLDNAYRYGSGQNGELKIFGEVMSCGRARLAISNAGPAILESQEKDVFELGISHNERGGIGLAVAKVLIEQLGGELSLTDSGRGSGRIEFVFRFPEDPTHLAGQSS